MVKHRHPLISTCACIARPVYGLIFLFKYVGHGAELAAPPGAGPADSADVFFAQQIINNACATQARQRAVRSTPRAHRGFARWLHRLRVAMHGRARCKSPAELAAKEVLDCERCTTT